MSAGAKIGSKSLVITLGYTLFQSFVGVESLLGMESTGPQFKVNKNSPKDKVKWPLKELPKAKLSKEAPT